MISGCANIARLPGAKHVCFLCLGENLIFYWSHELFIKFLLQTTHDYLISVTVFTVLTVFLSFDFLAKIQLQCHGDSFAKIQHLKPILANWRCQRISPSTLINAPLFLWTRIARRCLCTAKSLLLLLLSLMLLSTFLTTLSWTS